MRFSLFSRGRALLGLTLMLGVFVLPALAADTPPLPPMDQTPVLASSSPDPEWTDLGDEKAASQVGGTSRASIPESYRLLSLDFDGLKVRLASAPHEKDTKVAFSGFVMTLPMPDGRHQRFRVVESPILSDHLQAQMPDFRSYLAQGVDDPTAVLRLDTSILGFRAYGRTAQGTLWIDPYFVDANTHYLSAWKHDFAVPTGGFECLVEDEGIAWEPDGDKAVPTSGSELTTYRMAVTLTGEYVTYFGGIPFAQIQAAITINRINAVYEVDTAIRFNLTDILAFVNAAVDPFPNGSVVTSALLNQNQTALDAAFGSANYDIGHILTQGGGGGLAGLGVVCTSSKARGGTGRPVPNGDPFDIDYVAHEVGHQMGGSHTFNGSTGSCGGGNRSAANAYEPGSGSTIMAYAGICGSESVQSNSDPYFHVRSLEQIIARRNAAGCGVETATGNTPPVAIAGPDAVIPRDTPFYVVGGATDTDPSALTYCWEQYDLGNASPPLDPFGPLFRSFNPSTGNFRYFPDLGQTFTGSADQFENFPTVDRSLTLRLTVRDNSAGGGGVDDDELELTVSGAPFEVISPNGGETYGAGASIPVTWDVGGSQAENVKILMYYEGGFEFLAGSTPNDGSEQVSLPCGITSSDCRIWIEEVTGSLEGVHVFDVSNTTFTLTDGLPDFTPYVAPGYGDQIVVNNANVTTLPTALTAASESYLYWTFANLSDFTGCADFQAQVNLDQNEIWTFNNPNGFAPFTWVAWGPGVQQVRGGRHTTWMEADPDGLQAETDETNNGYARQWVWEPVNLAPSDPLVFTEPPERFAGFEFAPDGSAFYANMDGLRLAGNPGSEWRVSAISSVNGSDYDIYLFDPTSAPDNGFETPLISSRFGSGTTDLVLSNGAVLGNQTYDVGLERFGGDADYVVDHQIPTVVDPLGTARTGLTFAANQVISTGAFTVEPGQTGRVTLQISSVTTSQPVTVLVYSPLTGLSNRGGAFSSATVDPAGRAVIDVTMNDPGVWCYVVVRNAGEGLDPFTYDMRVLNTPADLATALVPGSYAPVVPTIDAPYNLGDPIPAPALLQGDVFSTGLYFHIVNNGPVATGSNQVASLIDGVVGTPLPGYDLPGNSSAIFSQAYAPFLIPGGRHTVGMFFDSTNMIDELYEDNNRYSEQWVWEPTQLPLFGTAARTAPLDRAGGWDDIPVDLIREYNVDGVRTPAYEPGIEDGYWGGYAIAPAAGNNVDLQVHPVSTGAQDGFAETLDMVAYFGSYIEFMLFDMDEVFPAGTAFDMGVVNATGTGEYTAHAVESIWLPTSPGTPLGETFTGLTMAPGELMGLFEFGTFDGTSLPVELTLTLQNQAGNADLTLQVFTRDDATGIYNPLQNIPDGFADNNLEGGNESLSLTLDPDLYYAIAVTKTSGLDVAKTADYSLVFGEPGVSAVDDTPRLAASIGNHPNPFNPMTTISFALTDAGRAKVRIYDTQGRLVRTLVDEDLNAGTHTRTWQGRDDQGRQVASGVYLARFDHPKGVENRSMVLVK